MFITRIGHIIPEHIRLGPGGLTRTTSSQGARVMCGRGGGRVTYFRTARPIPEYVWTTKSRFFFLFYDTVFKKWSLNKPIKLCKFQENVYTYFQKFQV